MHDVEAAALRLKTTPVDEKNVPDVAAAAIDRALLAKEAEDLKVAAQEWDAFAAAYANPTVSTSNPNYICYAAVTYEKTGQPAKADAPSIRWASSRWWTATGSAGEALKYAPNWKQLKETREVIATQKN
jgi:hypothetical protein